MSKEQNNIIKFTLYIKLIFKNVKIKNIIYLLKINFLNANAEIWKEKAADGGQIYYLLYN